MCATSPITLEIDTLLDDDPSYYHQISRAILSDLTQYPDLFTQLLQGFLTYPLKYSSQRIIDFINHIPSSKMIQEFEQFQQNLNESSEIPKDLGQLIIAFCNLILHHLSDAERQFNQILEHSPKNLYALYGLSSTCRLMHQNTRAIQILQRLIHLDPDNPLFLDRLGMIFGDENEYAKANQIFENCVRQYPHAISCYVDWAWINIEQRKFTEAENILNEARQSDSEDAFVICGLGDVQSLQDQLDASIPLYQESLELDPFLIHSLKNLGLTYMDMKKYDEAAQCFQRIIDWDPSKTDGFICQGWLMMEQEKFGIAIDWFKKALILDPKNGLIYLEIAKSYEKMKDDASQIQFLQLGSRNDATNADIYYAMGLYFFTHERFDQANRAFKTALQWNPNHILSINSLAAIESDVNDNFEAAEQLYNDALRIDPNNILTLMNLAFGYLNEDRIKESEAFFKKVLKINPHEASALYNIGMIAKNINNDYHTAEAFLLRAIEEQKDYLLALVDLSVLYSTELPDPDKAKIIMQQLDNFYPNDTDVQDFLKDLQYHRE